MSLKNKSIVIQERKEPLHQKFLKNFFYFKRDIKKICFFKILIPFKYHTAGMKPVKENKVVFLELTSPELSSNYRLLFDKLIREYNLDIHVHFLMQGSVNKAELYRRQVSFVKDAATAAYIIMNDSYNICGALKRRKGMHIMNMWHAAGAFKRFGFSIADKKFGMDYHEMKKFPLHPKYDLVTVSSPEVEWAYVEAMGKEKEREAVKGTGISRSDIFYDNAFLGNAKEHMTLLFPESEGKKIILYAPTFRGHVRKAESPDMLDIKMLKDKLGDDYVLVTKHHPFVKKRPLIDEEDKDFARDMSDLMSIEELLAVSDVCISDYSSLIFEFSLFEKPMLFYVYDLANYFDWRGFYYDFEELAPGPVCYTNRELIDNIKNFEKEFDKTKVREFRKKFMSGCDGHATERIFNEFFGERLLPWKREEALGEDMILNPVTRPFYEYTERLGRLRKIRRIFKKKYDSLIEKPVIKGSTALIVDEYTDSDLYIHLEKVATERGITFIGDTTVDASNAAEYAEILSGTENLVIAGEPYLLRMIDVKPETKTVQLVPEVFSYRKRWNSTAAVIAGLDKEDRDEFPIHSSYDMVIDGGSDYNLKEGGKILKTGNPATDIFFDKDYINESRAYLERIVPEIKGKKVLLILPEERVGLDVLLSGFLRRSYESLAEDYIVIVDTKDKKLIPEYLQGFAISPHLRLLDGIESGEIFLNDQIMNPGDAKSRDQDKDINADENLLHEFSTASLIASADTVISDYREEALFALVRDIPLIIYAPDISTYIHKKEFTVNPGELLSKVMAADEDELVRMIKGEREDSYYAAVDMLKEKCLKNPDGNASDRLFDEIISGN